MLPKGVLPPHFSFLWHVHFCVTSLFWFPVLANIAHSDTMIELSLKTQCITKKLRWKNILQGTASFIPRHSYRTTFVLFFLRTDVSSMFASAEEVRCSNLNFCSFNNLYCLNKKDQIFSSSQTRDKLKTLMIQEYEFRVWNTLIVVITFSVRSSFGELERLTWREIWRHESGRQR